MNGEQIRVEDESGDRKYFTIVPNYILNHSTAWERDVYIQMKRIAGEKGTCWTSRTTLAKQCGMSVDRLKKSLKYLVEHKWIELLGKKTIKTAGGTQQVNEYRIVDLWHLNNIFYQGGSPDNLPYPKGGRQTAERGGRQTTPNKNLREEEIPANADFPSTGKSDFSIVSDSTKELKPPRDQFVLGAANVWHRKCKEEYGRAPSGGLTKTMKIISEARKSLTEEQIKEKMMNWFKEEKQEEHEMMQITRCFSPFQIDKYLSNI